MRIKNLVLLAVTLIIFLQQSGTAALSNDRGQEEYGDLSLSNNEDRSALEADSISCYTYLVFLRAAASQLDPHHLYSGELEHQITCCWDQDHFDYELVTQVDSDIPMVGLTEEQAMRCCNWFENSALTDDRAAATTESGSYDLQQNDSWRVNPEARYHLVQDEAGNFVIVENEKSRPLMMGQKPGKPKEEGYQAIKKTIDQNRRSEESDQSGPQEPYKNRERRELFQGVAENNIEAEEASRKKAHASEQQAEALFRGDTKLASRYSKTAESYHRAARAYVEVAKAKANNNVEASEAFRKKAHASEQQAEASIKGDLELASRYEKAAEIYGGVFSCAARAYAEATDAKARKNFQASGAFLKQAHFYERQAEALIKGDKELASIYEKVARSYRMAARTYAEATDVKANNNIEASEAYINRAYAYEQQAEALIKGDKELVSFYEGVAQNYDRAVLAHLEAAKAKVFVSSLATISENLPVTLKISENKTSSLTKTPTATWNAALEATKKAHLARAIVWYTRKEAPEIEEARALWEQVHALEQEAFEQEEDPFQKSILRAETAWAQAEQATWLGRKSSNKATASSSEATQKANWLKAANEYTIAEKAWQEVIEAKEEVLCQKVDDNLKAQIEAEISWAKAEKLTCIYQAATYQARLQDFDPENRKPFEDAWKNNADKIKYLAEEWKKVWQAYDTIIKSSSLPKNEYTAWKDHLEEAHFWNIFYLVQPYYDEGVKFYDIARSFEKKALSMKSQDALFETTWNEAISSTKEFELLMKQAFDQYKRYNAKIISPPWQEVWGEYLNRARFLESSFRNLWAKALKTNQISNEAYNHAQKVSDDHTNLENINKARNDAIQKTVRSTIAWGEVVKALIKEKEVLSPERQGVLKKDLDPARYQEAYHTVRALELKAQQAKEIAQQAEDNAMAISSNYSNNFKESWAHAFEKNKALKLALDKVVEAYKSHRGRIPEDKQPGWDKKLHIAEKDQICLSGFIFFLNLSGNGEDQINKIPDGYICWIKARKAEQIATEAYNHAQKTGDDYANLENLNTAWNDAIQKTKKSAVAWGEAVDALNQKKEGLSPEQQEIWNQDLDQARYQEAHQEVRALWLKIQKTERVGYAETRRAEEALYANNESSFQQAWEGAEQQVKVGAETWKQVVNTYCEKREKIPQYYLSDWDKKLNEAEYQKIKWSIIGPEQMNAEKARFFALDAKQKSFFWTQKNWEVVNSWQKKNFESVYEDLAKKLEIARDEYKRLTQLYVEQKKDIPESERGEWEEVTNGIRSLAKYNTLDLIRLEAFKKEKDALKSKEEALKKENAKELDSEARKQVWGDVIKKMNDAADAWSELGIANNQDPTPIKDPSLGKEYEEYLKQASSNANNCRSHLSELERYKAGEIIRSTETLQNDLFNPFDNLFNNIRTEKNSIDQQKGSAYSKRIESLQNEKAAEFQGKKSTFLRSDLSTEYSMRTMKNNTLINDSLLTNFLNAIQAGEMANKAEENARFADIRSKDLFNFHWNDAHEKTEQAKLSWNFPIDDLSEYYQKQAIYKKAYYEANQFWLQAEMASGTALASMLERQVSWEFEKKLGQLDKTLKDSLEKIKLATEGWKKVIQQLLKTQKKDFYQSHFTEENRQKWEGFFDRAKNHINFLQHLEQTAVRHYETVKKYQSTSVAKEEMEYFLNELIASYQKMTGIVPYQWNNECHILLEKVKVEGEKILILKKAAAEEAFRKKARASEQQAEALIKQAEKECVL